MKLAGKLLTTGLVVGGVLGTLSIVNKLTESIAGELNTVLSAEERYYTWKYGDIFYEVKGARDAKPLMLIHGFAPGASSYEWRKNIDVLATQFRVYVVDLPGFGLSARSPIDYTPETFTDLISDFIREVISKPAIVVAHGITCAYVIADAYRSPGLLERLVLVTPLPTILQENHPGPLQGAWKFLLRTPLLGQFVYNLLTTRQVIRGYFERQGYHDQDLITGDLVESIFTSAHQPNSRFVMASFLSSYLTMDVHEAFARLQVPAVLVLAREGALAAPVVSNAFKSVNSQIDVRILDRCSQNPQDEQATRFNNLVREFAGATVTQ